MIFAIDIWGLRKIFGNLSLEIYIQIVIWYLCQEEGEPETDEERLEKLKKIRDTLRQVNFCSFFFDDLLLLLLLLTWKVEKDQGHPSSGGEPSLHCCCFGTVVVVVVCVLSLLLLLTTTCCWWCQCFWSRCCLKMEMVFMYKIKSSWNRVAFKIDFQIVHIFRTTSTM